MPTSGWSAEGYSRFLYFDAPACARHSAQTLAVCVSERDVSQQALWLMCHGRSALARLSSAGSSPAPAIVGQRVMLHALLPMACLHWRGSPRSEATSVAAR